jgi:hypothetical protein
MRPQLLLLAVVFLSTAVSCLGGTPLNVQQPGDDVDAGRSAPLACVEDSICGTGKVCVSGVCTASDGAGGACAVKADCGLELVCAAAVCVAPPERCANGDDCPGALVCDGFAGQCVPPAGGCAVDVDCAQAACGASTCVCTSGACVAGTPQQGQALVLTGFVLENHESDPPTQTTTLPAGLTLQPGGVLVIARNADQVAFERERGILPAGVQFINMRGAALSVPLINGGERFAITDADGVLVDGITITGESGKSYQRVRKSGVADPSSWTIAPDTEATPGTVDLPSSGVGLVISEWADASGTDKFIFEFIELYYAP